MGKKIKRVQVVRRKAPKMETVEQRNVNRTYHAQSRTIHEMAQVNEIEQERHKNKLDDLAPGFTAGLPEENKNQRLELRLTKLQKEVISKASRVSGFKNISDYILYIAITDSRNVIREQQILALSERDRVSFMQTLQHPPKPGKNLKKAMANYLSFKEDE